MENDALYRSLKEHLDAMPAGFPDCRDGAEIQLLRKFYTPEQARAALACTAMPEPVAAIAGRLGTDEPEAAEIIEQMAREGLLFRVRTSKGPLYAQPNFIMGIYEWHVNTIDRETAELADRYYEGMFAHHWKGKKTKQLRVVPVNTSIIQKDTVRSYDNIRSLVRGSGKGPYAVAPCICRVEQMKKGNTVTRPLETCLTFGFTAKYYIENGIGRELTEDELMAKLDECEKAALVPFGTNSQEITNMCMCDSDSCQLFRILKSYSRPADEVHSAYRAEINASLCSGCGVCAMRCQVGAIRESDAAAAKPGKNAYAVINERCIGCGLCVQRCPAAAVAMVRKETVPDVPENIFAMYGRMAQERGSI